MAGSPCWCACAFRPRCIWAGPLWDCCVTAGKQYFCSTQMQQAMVCIAVFLFGASAHSCGPAMGYKVGNLPDINQPANILEEIVWYKAKEIEAFREKQPLVMLQVRGVWVMSAGTAVLVRGMYCNSCRGLPAGCSVQERRRDNSA